MTSGGGGEGNQLEVVEGLTSPVQKMHPTVVIAEEEEKVAGEGGSVEELRQQLRKVTKEKEQLRQTNAVLQKTLSGLQKQVPEMCPSLSLPPSLPPSFPSSVSPCLPPSLSLPCSTSSLLSIFFIPSPSIPLFVSFSLFLWPASHLSQLNKVIEENCSLRNSVARSPPATSSSPPAMEQIQEEEGEEEGEGGGKQAPVYAQVDMSKVSDGITVCQKESINVCQNERMVV